MTYEEVINRLEDMRSRYDVGFSTSDRDLLEYLNFLLFNRRITNKSCGDCYRDSYLIIRTKLKTMNTLPEYEYMLNKGEVLHEFGSSEYYVNGVEPEVAEAYLKKYPQNISMFEKFPADWEDRIKGKSEGAVEAEVLKKPARKRSKKK